MRGVSLILLALAGANALPHPQSDVSIGDVLSSADNANRYSGGSQDYIKDDVLDDLFGDGIGGDSAYDGNSVKETVDTTSSSCTAYQSDGYSCVPYYLCEDGEIVTDGGGLIDIRSGFGATLDPGSSKCPGYLEVCCRDPNFDVHATTKAPIIIKPKPKPVPYQPQCGRRNINGVHVRISQTEYDGSTQFGEWPHMCAVLEKKSLNNGDDINFYTCGGSLIAPGIILTAAHCVQKLAAEKILVRCGEWDTQQTIEPEAHVDRYVQNIAIDPLFNPRNLQNDFALLYLTEDFKLSPHIDTMCLPANNAGTFSYQQENCVATGWGKDKFGKLGEYQVVMKQVTMNTVQKDICENRLRTTRLGSSFNLHDSFICAGGEKGKDTCKGDGGGPLVCPITSSDAYGAETITYVQAGIVAWGIDCGVEGNPGVYANVANGLCFIDYATKCYLGDSSYFGIHNCEDWGFKTRQRLNGQLVALEERLERLSHDATATPANLRNLNRRIYSFKDQVKSFDDFANTCIVVDPIHPVEPLDDLSGYARTSDYVDNSDIHAASDVLVDDAYTADVIVSGVQGGDGYVDGAQSSDDVHVVDVQSGDGYVDGAQSSNVQSGDGYVDGGKASEVHVGSAQGTAVY